MPKRRRPPVLPTPSDHRGDRAQNRRCARSGARRLMRALALGGLAIAAVPGVAAAAGGPACVASDPVNAFEVAQLYNSGISVRQDFALAAACYLVAAEAGNRAAQFNMGAMYDNGRGVKRDVADATLWYRRAAEQGDGRAAYALGLIYQKGGGVPRDRREALKWFVLAERNGITAAKGKVAALADRPASPGTAVQEPGLSEYRRGLAFLTGQGETQDSSVAFRWFDRGARAGGDLAAYALADLYEHGEGVERDYVMACAWYGIAAREAPAGGKLRAAAEKDAARLAARLAFGLRAAAEQETRDILAAMERARSDAAPSSGSSRR